jgi:hypothetical protein
MKKSAEYQSANILKLYAVRGGEKTREEEGRLSRITQRHGEERKAGGSRRDAEARRGKKQGRRRGGSHG